jgi:DNA-binding IclR family transcriptional regulator
MKKAVLETPSIQSLERGLWIPETVEKSIHPVPLAKLTALLGIDRRSVFRLANTLRRRGFLTNPNGRSAHILAFDLGVVPQVRLEHARRVRSRTGEGVGQQDR